MCISCSRHLGFDNKRQRIMFEMKQRNTEAEGGLPGIRLLPTFCRRVVSKVGSYEVTFAESWFLVFCIE